MKHLISIKIWAMTNRNLLITMKQKATLFTLLIATFFVSCVSSKKADAPIKFVAPQQKVEVAQAPPPVEQDSMIPFTRELYNRLRTNGQDIRKLQFFVDQTIILSRGLSQDKLYIDQGKVINQTGVNENKIELQALTPGVVEAIDPDGLRVSFESANNNLKFINNKYSPEFFIFSGTNWDDKGTAEVNYKGTTYRASCGTCSSIADAKLVVRQKDIMAGDTKTYIIPGRTIH